MITQVFFQTNGSGTTGHLRDQKMNKDTDLTPFTKINPKYVLNEHEE